MAAVPVTQFSLDVRSVGQPSDPDAFAELTGNLRIALADQGVVRIDEVSAGSAPAGARGIEVIGALTFLITAVQAGEALAKIVRAIRYYVARYAERHGPVHVTLGGVALHHGDESDLHAVVAALLAQPARPLTGVRRALIVANARYDDPALAGLRAPTHDAHALARVLGAPAIGGFDVELLADADERTVRRGVAAFFAGRDHDDLLLLHFSGHGVKDSRGRLYLTARDTELATLGATAIPASFINDQLNETRSRRVVLILDCCYSGAFSRAAMARASRDLHLADDFGTGTGRMVLTASSATEYAFEDGDLTMAEGRPSVFTAALVTGLATGEADLDGDGEISVDELYDYVHRTIRQQGHAQTPQKWSFGIEGRLTVARSVRPAALPASLLDDLASDRVPLRVAAVGSLVQLIRAGRPGQRETAIATMVRLRDGDDSMKVRAAAADAIAHHLGPGALIPSGQPGVRPAPLPPSQPPGPPGTRPLPPTTFPGPPASPSQALRMGRLAQTMAIISFATFWMPIAGPILAIVALAMADQAGKAARGSSGGPGGEQYIVRARILAVASLVITGLFWIIASRL
jgi:hypothetical protein